MMIKDPIEKAALGDQAIRTVIGVQEGRVTVVFGIKVNHYKLTVERAEEFVEGLMAALKETEPELIGSFPVLTADDGARVELACAAVRVGTLPDGRVIIDFGRELDFLRLSDQEAVDLGYGLLEAIKLARAGNHVPTDSVLNPSRRH